jgi:hypothetical protein
LSDSLLHLNGSFVVGVLGFYSLFIQCFGQHGSPTSTIKSYPTVACIIFFIVLMKRSATFACVESRWWFRWCLPCQRTRLTPWLSWLESTIIIKMENTCKHIFLDTFLQNW